VSRPAHATCVRELELLVGADISTITAPLTVQSVGLLGGIAMIRTSLSSPLEAEIEGYWPWLRAAKEARSGSAGQANPSLSRQRFEGRFVCSHVDVASVKVVPPIGPA